MASSRLNVDSPPLVDPHSLLRRVTFSFMLEFEIEQPFGVSSKGGIEAFEKDETWNKYEITVNLNSNSNWNWKKREENENFVINNL